ncbi:MAG: YdeI/OmpD-associated family protein [Bacteroidetes bacterium]|nr:YdeI/OmpD-associated family protein [Bacteroidota bacterium]
MEAIFFASAADFRDWLHVNHATATELLVGYYKVSSGKPSMSWSASVDEALCYGWIDGIRKSIDEERYTIRFTPRKPGSNWSAVNLEKVSQLITNGLMQPAGLAIYEKRKEAKTQVYSYENRPENLPAPFEEQLKAVPEAWTFIQKQAPSYRKTLFYWILSAKQPTTRQNRLEKSIAASAAENRLF